VNRERAAGNPVTHKGWGATDLQAAYQLPVTRPATATVAISIAHDAPNLESDLAVYRNQYGLPPCTTANGCFRKVNQYGQGAPLPRTDRGWAVEAALDVAMVSASCPSCRLLVVEADTASFADLGATENTAVRLGAQAVANSYGAPESAAAMASAGAYHQPGTAIVVASGDSGFTAASYPAVLDSVTAVGGTELTRAPTFRGFSERAWRLSGSGCSKFVAKPAWQPGGACSMRTVADVSAVAQNIAVYHAEEGGWLTVSGTSAAAPLVAGIYGLAGNAAQLPLGHTYQRAGALFDITTGSNDPTGAGAACDYDYLCVARVGYDAPTGLGTPNGLGAF
jgi:subtilase family serine protease